MSADERPRPERPNAESLKESESWLRLLVSRMPAILWTADSDLRITSALGGGLEPLGLAGQDIPGTTLYEWFPTEGQDFVLFRAARDALLGSPQVIQAQFMDRLFQATIEPLRDDQGSIVGIIGVSLDITGRRESEEGLRRQREITERLIDSSVDGILAFDRDCRYTVWNPGMERISGVPRDRVIGRVAFEVFPFLEEVGEDGFFYEALAGRSVKAENRPYAVPETGREGFFEAQYSPLHDSLGEVAGGLAIVRDITERKKLEAFRDEFISLAAHELRNPVSVVSGFAGYLLEMRSRLSSEQVQALEAIARHAERLTMLVRDLLDLSRLQQGSLEVRPQPLALSSIVQQAITLNQPPSGKSVTTDVSDDLVVRADPERLSQAVTNLLSNAYRYGGTSIDISARLHDEMVLLSVKDDGDGIPEDFVPQLFDSFARGPNAGNTPGSGLGLSIVRMALEAMGGRIAYAPATPRGACFNVTLPPPG